MKKIILSAFLFLLFAFPTNAAVQKATLINYLGTKVVVEVGSPLAQTLFGNGYVLMGAKAQPVLGGFNLFADTPEKIGTSTTSPMYMLTTTASTTLTVSIKNANALRLNTSLKASTTASYLLYTLEFSNDETASSRTWYGEDNMTQTSNVLGTHGATALVHTWTPANASASSTPHSFYHTNLDAKFLRITASIKGANGGLYMEAIPVEKSTY
jgi:hypothetical protein